MPSYQKNRPSNTTSVQSNSASTRCKIEVSVDHEDLSVIGCACLVTTPIPEVLTYLRSPRRSQPVWELHLEELGTDEPGEQHRESADLPGDQRHHGAVQCRGGMFELVGGVAAGAVQDVGPDRHHEEEHHDHRRGQVNRRGPTAQLDEH